MADDRQRKPRGKSAEHPAKRERDKETLDPTLLQQDDDEAADIEERTAHDRGGKRKDNHVIFDENESAK